ncbi:MAG: TolC family protein [Cyclobacteriaceae bacterium]
MKNLIVIVTWLLCYQLMAQESIRIQSEAQYQSEILKVTQILDDAHVLDSIVERAYRNAPVVQAFDSEIEMYEQEYIQKKRNWVTAFRLGVNIFSANTSITPENQSVTTYGVLPNLGLNLTIDPERLVNRKSYMRQAEDKRNRSYHLQQDQKMILKRKIMNLYYEYLTCLEAIVIRQHSLDARKQYLNVFEVDFKNGNRTFDEILVILHQVHLAEESLMKAHVQCLKMKSEIEVLQGIR